MGSRKHPYSTNPGEECSRGRSSNTAHGENSDQDVTEERNNGPIRGTRFFAIVRFQQFSCSLILSVRMEVMSARESDYCRGLAQDNGYIRRWDV